MNEMLKAGLILCQLILISKSRNGAGNFTYEVLNPEAFADFPDLQFGSVLTEEGEKKLVYSPLLHANVDKDGIPQPFETNLQIRRAKSRDGEMKWYPNLSLRGLTQESEEEGAARLAQTIKEEQALQEKRARERAELRELRANTGATPAEKIQLKMNKAIEEGDLDAVERLAAILNTLKSQETPKVVEEEIQREIPV